MITTQNLSMKKEIVEGIKAAKTAGTSILVSVVRKISNSDPVDFFAAGNEQLAGERFFWKEASSEAYLVGLGISKVIQANQTAEQFDLIEEEWNEVIKNSRIHNSYEVEGVGPLLFGAFSFDPYKEKTKLWANFADGLFHLPTFLLSKKNGESYLTTNVICTEHMEESFGDELEQMLAHILKEKRATYPLPEIIKEVEINPEQWKASVTKVEGELRTSETLKKVVLARELRLHFKEEIAIENILPHLITEQKDSYIFALESKGDCFIGATPERLVKKNSESILTTCLAGSIGRGQTVEEDERLGQELLTDDKNIIEHQYVVDMITEAIEETCKDIVIPDKPVLLKVRDIQHLYTPIVATAKKDTTLFTLVDRLHPTPAIGGLPKQESTEKIREIEELDRGFYAGPIGWMDYQGNGEFAVGIRSGLIQGDEASLFAGCGVVVNSDADAEYIETSIKFRPMLTALGRNN